MPESLEGLLETGLEPLARGGRPPLIVSGGREVSAFYRTQAVPREVSDEQLGQWYLDSERFTGKTRVWNAPDSFHTSINGSSCYPKWTIHHNPEDVPGEIFVARFSVGGHAVDYTITGATLESIRARLPQGLTRYERYSSDHRTIVESWG